MQRSFKTQFLWFAALAAVLVGGYAYLGYVVAPRLLRNALLDELPKRIDATAAVSEIAIDPFRLRATVRGLSIMGRDGERLLGFDRLFVELQFSSIWRRAFCFAHIDLTAPIVNAVRAGDGSINLLQLRPRSAAPDGGEPLPAVRIRSFNISRGVVTYQDRSRPEAFSARLEPIDFELRDFTTGVEGGRFTFSGSSNLVDKIEWHGHVSLQPAASEGEFRIEGLHLSALRAYLEGSLNAVVPSGTLDLAANYRFEEPGSPAAAQPGADPLGVAQLDVGRLLIRDVTVRPADGAIDWLAIPSLSIEGTHVDAIQRQARIERVALTGARVVAWLAPNGTLNLSQLIAAAPPGTVPPIAPAPAPVLTATPAAAAVRAPKPWRIDLGDLSIRDANLSFEDRTLKPAAKFALAPFGLQLGGLSQDLTKPVSVTLETQINGSGSIGVSGQWVPQPMAADLSLKVAAVDLAMLQPYVAQHTFLTLAAGTLGGTAKLHYGPRGTMPTVLVNGDLQIDKLHTIDDALNDDLVNCERLNVSGLLFSRNPDRIAIERVTARGAYARFIIEPDATINLKRVLADPSATAPSSAAGAVKRSAAEDSSAAAVPASTPVSIGSVDFQAGEVNFTDFTVAPNFTAGIHSLEGTVTGLSTRPGSRAKVDLHGAVDTFSPVSISGEVNVLGPLYTDLSMSFRNISLAVFNPYSGKFAGYNITKGKLSTELHYRIDGRKLDAQHHVVVEQLEFGDKTASKEAVSLPVKLAVALLKDRNGVIDLNLPVNGSLDDPHFKVAPVLWGALANVLEKAVAEPFKLLGELFGAGPDIQFVEFEPGLSTMEPAAAEKAARLVKALIERPQLKVDVPIGMVAEVDAPALAAAAVDAEILAAQPGYGRLDAAGRVDLLTKLYVRDVGAAPRFPDPLLAIQSKTDLANAKLDFLRQALLAHTKVGDEELRRLGQQRAMNLQQALLADPQVAAERVFLVANDKAAFKDGHVQLELTLE